MGRVLAGGLWLFGSGFAAWGYTAGFGPAVAMGGLVMITASIVYEIDLTEHGLETEMETNPKTETEIMEPLHRHATEEPTADQHHVPMHVTHQEDHCGCGERLWSNVNGGYDCHNCALGGTVHD